MQPSECCIFRMTIASVIGSCITLLLVRGLDPVVALLLIPIGGSAATVLVILLFQAVSLTLAARSRPH
ncbi:CBS-domain-containing membrane protein [Methylobacterium sp. PvP062]|uniref:Uncharacterized protein n=3 Tax=Methylobacteriaceae TaxID=119045 RepID=B1LZV6_METRJ|nr:hypothetical protein [Methylobacterium radiotolerans]ACB23004.1 hypothetical protein Mrad2831_0995 [Methylobacterium radiotolerans JCM 2831]MBP2500161.1 CBS-domain-containing membrane protein [Methylobacterium sp. PvP109]KTS09470.1 hypothetical protein SB3_11640 [Methylobacterium radiotolerans]KTS46869.1 hypothetical protein SB2_15625 [Methylobacterium radiotolerans]KZC01685.1 hypothetical protein AU375_02107 [Methylobacterium radiotolerans]